MGCFDGTKLESELAFTFQWKSVDHKAFDQTTGDIAPKWASLASIINL